MANSRPGRNAAENGMQKQFTCANGHAWAVDLKRGLAVAAISCPTCGAAAVTATPADQQQATTPFPRAEPTTLPAPRSPDGGLPEQFGRYVIKKLLGRGGMGSVYLAEDRQLGREIALKIPTSFVEDPIEGVQRFYREARAAGSFHHPNLCPVYEVG